MRKVTELTEKEVIHCPTQEIWDKIIALNPDNDCGSDWWYSYGKETCYRPKSWAGTGIACFRQWCLDNDYTVYPHTEFLEDLDLKQELIKFAEWYKTEDVKITGNLFITCAKTVVDNYLNRKLTITKEEAEKLLNNKYTIE